MDNFRHHKPTQNKQQNLIDGFVRGQSRSSEAGFQFKRHTSYQPTTRAKQDGLNRNNRYFYTENNNSSGPVRQRSFGQSGDAQAPKDSEPANKPKKLQGRLGRLGKTKFALKGFVVLFLVSIVTGGYLFGKGYLKARQIFKGGGGAVALQENADPSTLNGEGDGRVNLLLLGTGGEEHDNASFLTDTILLVSIDPIQKEAALLSIPRDFYTKTEYGSMKINAVYKIARNAHLNKNPKDKDGSEKAGFDAVEQVVEKSMGVPIHYHAMVDFVGFKKAIDTVGGITINVKDPVSEVMWIDGRSYTLNVKKGQESFDGFRALAYARSRHTSPRGDFDRSERQREMLIALKDKILSRSTLSNPIKLNQLLGDFGDHMRTNLSPSEMLRLREIGSEISGDKIQSISLVDPPNVLIASANVGGASAQIPKAGMNNYKEIHNFIRNKLKDGYLRNENATVSIFNGTNVTGLAARTAEELESYGYNISEVANSPIKDQVKTTVVDLRGGSKKYTKAYLEKRFGVSVVNSLPDNRIVPGDADFVIILGQNEQNRLQN